MFVVPFLSDRFDQPMATLTSLHVSLRVMTANSLPSVSALFIYFTPNRLHFFLIHIIESYSLNPRTGKVDLSQNKKEMEESMSDVAWF